MSSALSALALVYLMLLTALQTSQTISTSVGQVMNPSTAADRLHIADENQTGNIRTDERHGESGDQPESRWICSNEVKHFSLGLKLAVKFISCCIVLVVLH